MKDRACIMVSGSGVSAQLVSAGDDGQFIKPLIHWGSDPTYERLSDDYHNNPGIPESTRSYIATVLNLTHKPFHNLNERRPFYRNVCSLSEAIKFFDNDENRHKYTVLVWLQFPRGGYYRVVHYHGAGGAGANWQLESVLTTEEALVFHNEAVRAAVARQHNRHDHRSGLVRAFERVEQIEHKLLHGVS